LPVGPAIKAKPNSVAVVGVKVAVSAHLYRSGKSKLPDMVASLYNPISSRISPLCQKRVSRYRY